MLDRNNAVLLIADIVAISFIGVIPLNIYILMSYHYSICIATFCFVSTFEIIYSSFCNSGVFGHQCKEFKSMTLTS